MHIIKNTTTKEERVERSKIKNKKYQKLVSELTYETEGTVFLLSLKNACIERLILGDNYKVDYV